MGSHKRIINKIEREHIVSLMEHGKRADGRSLNEVRPVKITTGYIQKAEGSALVELGHTKVLAGVKYMVGEPYSDSPNSGVLTVGAELSPIASPFFQMGPPNPQTIELARVTDRAIRESAAVKFDDLFIIPGEKVWIIFLDLYVLNDDGGLFDASGLAAMAALATLELPTIKKDSNGEVEVDENGKVQFVDGETTKVPVNHYTLSVTSASIEGKIIIDPSRDERELQDYRVTLGITEENQLVSAQKGEFGVLKSGELEQIIDDSIIVAAHYREELMKALE
ncbi:MAG: exosome complex protein Rrp42 [Candidatus Heimdallarchaeota archaeon]|nr:exosome complex protein Rrp42 [Candidatus Heimdallarchaeota archaeon]MCK5047890.1 exosome complex protein Rrp42 [Candidatus Heimdallarchaeota archaeon]